MTDEQVKNMTLEQKLGTVLCVRRFHIPAEREEILELTKEGKALCFQISTNDMARDEIAAISATTDRPLIFVADMEQGYSPSGLPAVPLLTLAACQNPEYTRIYARALASSARADGYTGTWGPVVDILCGNAPCKVQRVFGDTAEKVTEQARLILESFRENNFAGCGKHYPGGIEFPYDTHMAEGRSDTDEATLWARNMIPYLTLMKEGLLPAVMTEHTVFRAIDPSLPASLSPKVIGLLRSAGFDGLIYTDSLAMSGILQKYGEGRAMGLAIAAGNDIILPNYRTPHKECLRMLTEEFRRGTFTEERLNEAVSHALIAAKRARQPAPAPYTVTEETAKTLRAVSRDAITAVTDKGVLAALPDPERRRLFVILTGMGFDEDSPAKEIGFGSWYDPARIADCVRKEFPAAEIAFHKEFPTASENDRLLTRIAGHDEVVFVTYCMTAAYLGSDCLTRRIEALINSVILSGKVKAVLHFGNPYAVEPLLHVERLLFGYHAPESQPYAVEVLAGKIPAHGKLPFALNLA